MGREIVMSLLQTFISLNLLNFVAFYSEFSETYILLIFLFIEMGSQLYEGIE